MIASLQEVKDYLGITDNSQDTLLTSLLESADALVKSYTGRDFEEQTYTHLFNWKGELEFLLKQYPVSVLTSFQYNTGSFSTPSWTDFDQDSYKPDPETGIVWSMFNIPKWIQNIRAVYTAWYTAEDMPGDIKNAVIKLTATYYNWSKSDGIKSESVDWASLVYDKTMDWIPSDILLVLNRYKNVQIF